MVVLKLKQNWIMQFCITYDHIYSVQFIVTKNWTLSNLIESFLELLKYTIVNEFAPIRRYVFLQEIRPTQC